MSENFNQVFTANTKSSPLVWSDKHFENIMFFPPGYSVVNKTYQFWDHDHTKPTSDKWGVIRLDTLTASEILEGALDGWSPKKSNTTLEERLACLHPLSHTKIKKTLEDSVKNNTDISLKTITDKLGAGIYLDFSCSGLILKIFDYEINKYITYNPDRKYEFMKDVLPFYNAIQEGLEEITHYNKLSWNNIVSRKNEVELNQRQKDLIDASKEFKKLTTTLQRDSNANRAFTEQKMKGGKKKKTKKVKRKRKTYKRKHRNKKRGTKSRKKKTRRKR